jgi:hypothetical protein
MPLALYMMKVVADPDAPATCAELNAAAHPSWPDGPSPTWGDPYGGLSFFDARPAVRWIGTPAGPDPASSPEIFTRYETGSEPAAPRGGAVWEIKARLLAGSLLPLGRLPSRPVP